MASKTADVNVNLLAADGPDQLERVSGMAHLTGIVVDVRPAAGAAALAGSAARFPGQLALAQQGAPLALPGQPGMSAAF